MIKETVKIIFEGLAQSAIARSQKGTVALILKDDTAGDAITTYSLGDTITGEPWTAENIKYIEYAFKGNPQKVICIKVATGAGDLTAATVLLENIDFDYVAVPSGSAQDMTDISNKVKAESWRNNGKKAIVTDVVADSEATINLATTGIKIGDEACTSAGFTARLAGVLAGLPMTQSVDGYVFTDVTEFTLSLDEDADIAAGKFILGYNNGKIKPMAENNSLTTLTETKTAVFQSIKGMETMDLIQKDVYDVFLDQYQGQRINSYTNNLVWIQLLRGYMATLQSIGALDPDRAVSASFDIKVKTLYLQSIGVDTSKLTEQQIKEHPSARKTFTYVNGAIGYTFGSLEFRMGLV